MATQTPEQRAMADKAASELGVVIPPSTPDPSPGAAPVTSTPTDKFMETLTQKLMGQADVISSLDSNIEQSYTSAASGIRAGADAEKARIESEYSRAAQYRQTTGTNQIVSELEGRRGMATSRTALIALDTEIQKDLKDLAQRKNELILQGEAAAASKIAELEVDKLKFQAEAKQKYFGNLLGMGQFMQGQQSFEETRRQFNIEQEAARKRDEFARMDANRSFALESKSFAEGIRQFEKNYGFNLMKFNADEAQRDFENMMSEKQYGLQWKQYLLSKDLNDAQIKKINYEMTPKLGEDGVTIPLGNANGTDAVFKPFSTLTAAQQDKVSSILTVMPIINRAEALYAEAVAADGRQAYDSPLARLGGGVLASPGAKEGAYQGVVERARREFGATTGSSPEWKRYKEFVDSNVTLIAKGIKMESGVLSNQDMSRAVSSLPNLGDSPNYAGAGKFKDLRMQMNSNLSQFGSVSEKNMSTSTTATTPTQASPQQYQLSDGSIVTLQPDGTYQ